MIIRCVAIVVMLQAVGWGSIQNGRFEIPDPNLATEYFTPPMDWNIENYAGLHNAFIVEPEYGQNITWNIGRPAQGEAFCLLSTGDIFGPGSDPQITRSSISQIITFACGDILMGSYFFGTSDYTPYNDTANITLFPVDPNGGLRDILLATVSVVDVGDFGSTENWLEFAYTFDEVTQGEYVLTCEVLDVRDTKYKSYLAVDNLRVCYGTPLFGDINFDCAVDLTDFNLFSHVWLSDCNDPNSYDPNYVCLESDFNGDELIDPNDLILMSEYWLHNYRAE